MDISVALSRVLLKFDTSVGLLTLREPLMSNGSTVPPIFKQSFCLNMLTMFRTLVSVIYTRVYYTITCGA